MVEGTTKRCDGVRRRTPETANDSIRRTFTYVSLCNRKVQVLNFHEGGVISKIYNQHHGRLIKIVTLTYDLQMQGYYVPYYLLLSTHNGPHRRHKPSATDTDKKKNMNELLGIYWIYCGKNSIKIKVSERKSIKARGNISYELLFFIIIIST